MFDNVERGHYLIGDREMYFRSKWEANYALYLDWLKKNKAIKNWWYEVEWFEFPIKHGTTRYLPDFKVEENDGSFTYHEVKGYMTSKSRVQLRRMARYFPHIKLLLIDRDGMKAISKYKKLLKFY